MDVGIPNILPEAVEAESGIAGSERDLAVKIVGRWRPGWHGSVEPHESLAWKRARPDVYDDVLSRDQVEAVAEQPALALRRRTAPSNYSFGQSLRQLRRRRGLSQAQLAEQVGADVSYISKLENGHVPPPSDHLLMALADGLGVTNEQLLAAAGRVPKDFVEMVMANPVALQFMKEAWHAQLDIEGWQKLLTALRDLIRHDTLRRSMPGRGEGER